MATDSGRGLSQFRYASMTEQASHALMQDLTPGVELPAPLQRELEKRCARHRVVAIRLGLAEAERPVQRLRRSHLRQRVEEHPAVAARTRLADHCLGKLPAETAATRHGPHVQPLHLARVFVDPPERNAAVIGEQHELVQAERLCELGLEVLEREVDAEAVRVLAKEA